MALRAPIKLPDPLESFVPVGKDPLEEFTPVGGDPLEGFVPASPSLVRRGYQAAVEPFVKSVFEAGPAFEEAVRTGVGAVTAPTPGVPFERMVLQKLMAALQLAGSPFAALKPTGKHITRPGGEALARLFGGRPGERSYEAVGEAFEELPAIAAMAVQPLLVGRSGVPPAVVPPPEGVPLSHRITSRAEATLRAETVIERSRAPGKEFRPESAPPPTKTRAARGPAIPKPEVVPEVPESMLSMAAKEQIETLEVMLGETSPRYLRPTGERALREAFPLPEGGGALGFQVIRPTRESRLHRPGEVRFTEGDINLRETPPSLRKLNEIGGGKGLRIEPHGKGYRIVDDVAYQAESLWDAQAYVDVYPKVIRGGVSEGIPLPRPPRLVWRQPSKVKDVPPEAVRLDIDLGSRELNEIGWWNWNMADPAHTFRRMGIGDVGQHLLRPIDTWRDYYGTFVQRMRVWQQAAGVRPESSARMWRVAFGKPVGGDLQSVTAAERSVIDEWRQLAGEWLPYINAKRKLSKLPEVPAGTNYAPAIIEDAMVTLMRHAKQFGQPQASTLPPEVFQAIHAIPKDRFLGHILERRGRLPYKQDFWAATNAYMKVVTEARAADEVLPVVRELTGKGSRLSEHAKDYVTWFAQTEILKRPTGVDLAFQNTLGNIHKALIRNLDRIPRWNPWDPAAPKGSWAYRPETLAFLTDDAVREVVFNVPRFGFLLEPKPLSRLVTGLKALSYSSLIGMNMRTMALNLSQPIIGPALLKGSTVQRFGDFYAGYGKAMAEYLAPFYRAMKRGTTLAAERATLIQKYERLGVLSVMEEIYGGTGPLSRLRQKLVDFTFWNMKTSEFINRVSQYHGKTRNLARVEGVFGEEAAQYARQFSDMINFRYGHGWRAPFASRSPLGNLLMHYQTFTIKHLQLLGSLAKGMVSPESIPKFFKAAQRPGGAVQYLEAMPMFERTALLRYVTHAGAVATGLSALGTPAFRYFLRGVVPEVFAGPLVDLAKGTFGMLTSGDAKQFVRGVENLIPLRRFMEQVGIVGGEDDEPRL